MVLGALLNPFLIKQCNLIRLILGGALVVLIGILGMLIPFATVGPGVLSLFLPTLVIYAGQSITFANVAAYGLASATNKSNASAVLNFITIACAVIALFASQLFAAGYDLSLPLSFFLFVLVMLGLTFGLKKAQDLSTR
ncbi:MAG: hypothetical protein JSR46_05890 [Verrucomicrobia bacterium]|nr:hypothetical protein [Verrucomicrobiota bacterium]